MARRKPWIVALVLVAMLAGLLPQTGARAEAAEPPLSLHGAVMTLQGYGVVDKKPEAELRLEDEITRAEFAKILGAALGEQKLADASKTRAAFLDTDGHWANGWITVAKGRGLFLGRGDGRFYPEAPVTYAEVVTALLRLIGRADQANQGQWPWGAALAAADVGLVPSDMNVGGRLMANASRGDVFRLTATAIGRIKLAGSGKTLLQSLGDVTPPVLKLDGFPGLAERSSIVVSGQAGDAVAVFIQDQAVEPQVDGTFSAQLSLLPGANQIDVVAVDGAGNRAEATAVIQSRQVSGVRVEPETINASVGATFAPPAVVRYEGESRFPADGEVTWGYDTAAFAIDPKTGKFKALKAGEYTLRAILGDHQATAQVVVAGDPAQVELTVDRSTLASGSAPAAMHIRVLDDQGRLSTGASYSVALTMVPDGLVTLETKTAKTVNGQATVYMVPGRTAGALGLQASVSVGGKKIESLMLPLQVEAGALAGIRLETTPANGTEVPGQQVSIVATAVDQSGAPIAVTEDTEVVLTGSDSGVLSLTQNRAIIKKGAVSSAMGGQNGAGSSTGLAGVSTITATVADKLRLAVEEASFTARASRGMERLQVEVVRPVALADDLNATVVSVSRLDGNGNVVTWDRDPVVLIPSVTTVSVMPIADSAGVATFAIRSSNAGRVNLTAGVPGDSSLNSPPVEVAFVKPVTGSTAAKAVITTDARAVTAGDILNVYVALQDSKGGAMANPGAPLVYTLRNEGDGLLSTTDFVIPTGATRSDYGQINAPPAAGKLSVSGLLVGGKALPKFEMTVAAAPVGKPVPTIAGMNLVAIPAETTRQLQPGEETRILVQARNGDQLLNDSYAFTIKVRLNGKELTELPSSLQVTLGNKSVAGLVGRTQAGEAEIWVKYTGVGTIEVEPVPVATTATAYDQWGLAGAGKASTGFKTAKAQVAYEPGPLTQLLVTTTPSLGDPMQGVIKAAPGRTVTVRLAPADALGNLTGNGCVATLTRVEAEGSDAQAVRIGADLLGSISGPVGISGYVDFTVTALTGAEETVEWVPSAVCGNAVLTTAANVQIITTLAAVSRPTIETLSGNVGGQSSITKKDTSLALRIGRLTDVAGPVEVQVYDSYTNTLIGRYGPVYPSAAQTDQRTVQIPLTAFGEPGRNVSIRIRLNSGANVSDLSSIRTFFYPNYNE